MPAPVSTSTWWRDGVSIAGSDPGRGDGAMASLADGRCAGRTRAMDRHVGSALALFAAGAPSQETAADVAARVRAGGWLEVSKYRRGERGDLESWSTAHTGDPDRGEWLPVLDGSALRLGNLGAIGWFSLFCHGDGDLLAMTDVEFHFGALGLGASDVELRQFLARPAPSFDGMRGRAELL